MKDLLIPVIGVDRLRMATDGTGVRTLIGVYGCPLRCKYCLNPHSWNGNQKPMLYTPRQLYEEVAIDSIYFQATNGGITIGGGEPLMYMDAIARFADLCPDGWSLWAETALHVDPQKVRKAAEVFDHFIVDIKTTHEEIYKAYTGKDLAPALSNLLMLRDLVGAERITVRVPVIPGYADAQKQRETAEKLKSLGFSSLDLFTYRTE